MIRFQCIQPPGKMYPKLRHRESIQQFPEHLSDLLCIQRLAVCHHSVDTELLMQLLLHCRGSCTGGLSGIYYNKVGLSRFLHILDGPFFRGSIILTGNVRNGTVGSNHQAKGRMLIHDLFRPQFRSLGHGDLMVIPGCGDHPGNPLLFSPHCPIHHIAHRVNKPQSEFRCSVGRNLHRFLRNKLGFRGHDGSAAAALGQFIPCPFRPVGIGNIGNHQCFHDPLDEGGFPGPHRAYHADVDIAPGTPGNILVNAVHSVSSLPAGKTLLPWVYCKVCPSPPC